MSATIDLKFQGRPGVIATAVISVGGGVVLIDPGPSSCLPTLEAGLAALQHTLADVRAVLLTHIHLDHAGAAGTLAGRVPGLPVYVHEVGARHLASPEKLLASATRLYGAAMDTLWGEFKAVPAASLKALSGGEALTIDGRRFDVAYTPGHAVHHVSYLDRSDGTAYVGDTAGIRVRPGYILPATPPPDIDLEQWEASLQRIEAWRPERLYLTHFGEGDVPATHLAMYREALAAVAASVKASLAGDGDDDSRIAAWTDWLRADVRRRLPEQDVEAIETAAPFRQLWQGLARYWRKRDEVGKASGQAR
jgi:glyoxylase-like metal-dependent hydrolase (beta-lactamase superfamily II)